MQQPNRQPLDEEMLPRQWDARESPFHYASKEEDRVAVYVWDLPVRATHWLNVLSILVLSFTGYYIYSPWIVTSGEASNQYLMGIFRFVHFVFAFIFTMTVLFRIYWSFVGSKYGGWKQMFPATKARRRGIWKMWGYYLFIRKEAPPVVGHNPLAGAMYTVLYLGFIAQILTGFALYSVAHTNSIWNTLFGWIVTLVGPATLRLLHDIVMWLIIAFVTHHVYSAILIDIEERSGLVSSIVTGFKLLTPHHIQDAKDEEQDNGPKRKKANRKGIAG
jgi:Ni/Fe-hydrogenase 1 B-type cytochrome subunit